MGKGSYITQVPLTIPSCKLWMIGNDLSQSNMTESAGRVSSIRNLASNAPITQVTGANQPANTGTINGLSAISFDNDNARLFNTNIPAYTNTTIICVAMVSVLNTQGIVVGGTTSTRQTMRFNLDASNGFTCGDATSVVTYAPGGNSLNVPKILCVTADVPTTTRNLYQNSFSAVATTGSYNGTLGATLLGASGDSSNSRGGFYLGEAIVYNRVLSSTELATVFVYLSNKWGISVA